MMATLQLALLLLPLFFHEGEGTLQGTPQLTYKPSVWNGTNGVKHVVFVSVAGFSPATTLAAMAKKLIDRNNMDVKIDFFCYEQDSMEVRRILPEGSLHYFDHGWGPYPDDLRDEVNEKVGRSNVEGLPALAASMAQSYAYEVSQLWRFINKTSPDLFVIDIFTASAVDLCAHLNVPYVLHYHPGSLGFGFVGDSLASPSPISGQGLKELTFWGRLEKIWDTFRIIPKMISGPAMDLSKQRALVGLPDFVEPDKNIRNKVIIANVVWGFEYSIPMSPLFRPVGMYVDKDPTKAYPKTRSDHQTLRWIRSTPRKKVVFVSFGTEAMPSESHLQTIIKGIIDAGYRALIAVRKRVMEHYHITESILRLRADTCGSYSKRDLRVEQNWVNSNMVLKSSGVALFITHGGIRSFTEAAYAHIPIIVWAYGADRKSLGARVRDRELGSMLDPFTSNSGDVKKAILELLEPQRRREIVSNLRTFCKLNDVAGAGSAGGARVIEEVLEFGYQHLIPIFNNMSFIERNALDALFVVFLLTVLLPMGIISFGIQMFCPRCCKCGKKRKLS